MLKIKELNMSGRYYLYSFALVMSITRDMSTNPIRKIKPLQMNSL